MKVLWLLDGGKKWPGIHLYCGALIIRIRDKDERQ